MASVSDALGGQPWALLASAALAVRDPVVNQAAKFTYHQQHVQRILAISSSTSSIVFCLAAFYMFLAIDPKRLVFRHHLIAFLLFYDFLKAIILLIYPTWLLAHNNTYYNDDFCQVVGFFTATAIEGADFAIVAFAIHIFLLIFKPQLTVRFAHSGRTEGGLYTFRKYVYVLLVVIPLVLASLAYVRDTGYFSYVCWCLLPQQPIWYRLVLSWLPRYIIVITILTVYGMIYFHVIKEFKSLGGVFKNMGDAREAAADARRRELLLKQWPTFFLSLGYAYRSLVGSLRRKLNLSVPNENELERITTIVSNTDDVNSRGQHKEKQQNDDELVETVPPLHIYNENLENFRNRQKIIQKQMKSIFVYPIAYIFIWVFPFVLYVTQIKYEPSHAPIYWLNCIGAFMQPFNGFVDSLVFFYREVPWQYTVMENFEKHNSARINAMVQQQQQFQEEDGLRQLLVATGSIPSSAKLALPRQSYSLDGIAVGLLEYPWWRQALHWLKLPFFQLPTHENMAKLQLTLLKNLEHGGSLNGSTAGGAAAVYLRQTSLATGQDQFHDVSGLGGPTDKSGGLHDFSNILGGELSERDFRSATSGGLENYTLDFLKKRSSFSASISAAIPSAHKAVSLNGNKRTKHLSTSGRLSVGGELQHRQVTVNETEAEGTELDFMEILKRGPQQ